jgi:ADP-heptose:LPS heptosyltransferase
VFPQLKKHFRNAKITLICRKHCTPIYENNSYIDEIICIDEHLPPEPDPREEFATFKRIMGNRYFDMFLNIHYNARNHYLDCLFSTLKAKYRVA